MIYQNMSIEEAIETQENASIDNPNISVLEVPFQRAIPETLDGYGRTVRDFHNEKIDFVPWPALGWRSVEPGTGIDGGVAQGVFEMRRVGDYQLAVNSAVGSQYVTGWFCDPAKASRRSLNANRARIFVRYANYHPDGGQIFFPRNAEPFVALLALPGDDVRPENFVAFYCDGSFGIHVNPGVWHAPVYPLSDEVVFNNKQGRVHACIHCDMLNEYNVYLSVPLCRPASRAT